jgi:hypothetical protein
VSKKSMNDYSKNNPLNRVVCAAIRSDNGLVICGARHYDSVMREVAKHLEYDFEKKYRRGIH